MEHRKTKRFSSYAKIILLEQNKLGYLRDLNHLGCQIDFLEPPALQVNDEIAVRIIPNEEFGLPLLDLTLVVKWMKKESELFFSIGAALSQIPDKHRNTFEKLLAAFTD
ncbi:MAG TPA: hypothetical protein VMX75_11390 [Spirochaetia bacterium]|nr:hypothetical protein [Spirochaetia bacterium]